MTTPLAATHMKRVFGHEYLAAIQTGFFFNRPTFRVHRFSSMVLYAAYQQEWLQNFWRAEFCVGHRRAHCGTFPWPRAKECRVMEISEDEWEFLLHKSAQTLMRTNHKNRWYT
jgi:hypothetical protein